MKFKSFLYGCLPGLFLAFALSACVSGAPGDKVKEALILPDPVTAPDLAAAPRSYENHFRKALRLLHVSGRTDFDLHQARVGFETAARLS
ncbi:MAG TPA: hypothetical protein DHK64_14880, partial [Rhodobiaceae bacterium]|nr:hypothetical protein [Rhodobiaceae bacterium]